MGDIRDENNGVVLTEEQKEVFNNVSQYFPQNSVDNWANLVNTDEISGGELTTEEINTNRVIEEKAKILSENIKKEAIDIIKGALKNKGYSQEYIEIICNEKQTTNIQQIMIDRRNFEITLKEVIRALFVKQDRAIRNQLKETEDGMKQAIIESAMKTYGFSIIPFGLTKDPNAQEVADQIVAEATVR